MHTRLVRAAAPAIVALGLWLPTLSAHAQVALSPGDRIKLACPTGTSAAPDHPCRSVYYYGADGKRYVFPTSKTYFTWYSDFNNIKIVSLEQIGGITIGGNVTHRAGVKMVKITTDPTVYVVSKNGILRSIPSEAVAAALYGSNWNQQIDDIPDPFFINYKVGSGLQNSQSYAKTTVMNGVPSINVDKLLVAPPPGYVDIKQSTGFNPASLTVARDASVTWIALDGSVPQVASDPHPTHTALPGLDSGPLGMGASWTFIFNSAGTWGYHDHTSPGHTGTITVQ